MAFTSSLSLLPLLLLLLLLTLAPPAHSFKFLSNFKLPTLPGIDEVKGNAKFGGKKLCVVTGTSSGLGRKTARALLRTGEYHVIGAVRDLDKMDVVCDLEEFDRSSFTAMHLELNSFASVRSFVEELDEFKGGKAVDRLICNAGVYQPSLPHAKVRGLGVGGGGWGVLILGGSAVLSSIFLLSFSFPLLSPPDPSPLLSFTSLPPILSLSLQFPLPFSLSLSLQWSEDGHEQTMQINFLSHFLLISKLMPGMSLADDPRIITVGSVTGNDNTVGGGGVYPVADLKQLEGLKAGFSNPISMLDGYNFIGAKAYKDSKLCLMMTANMLHDRYHKQTGIAFSSIYPGCIAESPLFREKRPWFRKYFPVFMKFVTGEKEEERERTLTEGGTGGGRGGLYTGGRRRVSG